MSTPDDTALSPKTEAGSLVSPQAGSGTAVPVPSDDDLRALIAAGDVLATAATTFAVNRALGKYRRAAPHTLVSAMARELLELRGMRNPRHACEAIPDSAQTDEEVEAAPVCWYREGHESPHQWEVDAAEAVTVVTGEPQRGDLPNDSSCDAVMARRAAEGGK